MTRVLVTGSADGIGAQTARDLLERGCEVVLHARSAERAEAARGAVPGAAGVAVGELASLSSTRAMAEALAGDRFDVVIHNAGVQESGARQRPVTGDGLERTFQVNVLAPYLLTALLPPPGRLITLSSGLQAQGDLRLDDLQRERRRWDGMAAYCDSKLADVVLAFAVARRWPSVRSHAVDPGWIRTRMGGRGAPGELGQGAATQVWLATSDEPAALTSGRFWKDRREQRPHPSARDEALQDGLLAACAALTGVELPPA